MAEEMEKIAFEYWSDPLCIWAYVAQAKLDRIIGDFGDKLEVKYHIVPVFGSIRERLTSGVWSEKGIEGRIAATKRVAHAQGCPEVDGECWREEQPASSWGPGIALKAAFCLAEEGTIEQGVAAAYQWRIRQKFFVENKNIGRREVQLETAEELRIPRAALEARLDDSRALASLWEDYQRKEKLRIQGSPTYVFDGGRAMLYGNFSFGVLHATVEELAKGLDAGGSACP